METEIRKSGKFISKGGNVMQQNLKEIVIQETSNYIWHKISCNYDFPDEPEDRETIDSLTENICRLVMDKVKNVEYETIEKEVKKALNRKKIKSEIRQLEMYGGFNDKNKIYCYDWTPISILPKKIQKYVPKWEEEIKLYIKKGKNLEKYKKCVYINFTYRKKIYYIYSNFFKSNKSSFQDKILHAISKTIRKDIQDLVHDYDETFIE